MSKRLTSTKLIYTVIFSMADMYPYGQRFIIVFEMRSRIFWGKMMKLASVKSRQHALSAHHGTCLRPCVVNTLSPQRQGFPITFCLMTILHSIHIALELVLSGSVDDFTLNRQQATSGIMKKNTDAITSRSVCNSLRPRKNGRHFADDTNAFYWMKMLDSIKKITDICC